MTEVNIRALYSLCIAGGLWEAALIDLATRPIFNSFIFKGGDLGYFKTSCHCLQLVSPLYWFTLSNTELIRSRSTQ